MMIFLPHQKNAGIDDFSFILQKFIYNWNKNPLKMFINPQIAHKSDEMHENNEI